MPDSTIPEAGALADDLLLAACSKTLQRLGAEVRIRSDGENLVRALVAAPAFAPRARPAQADRESFRGVIAGALERPGAAPVARVEACGLPNLLHELVHVALAGQLADDHGIDYQAIPFDLGTPAGRTVLWDEVAACVVSCAYLLGGSGEDDDWVRVDGWFDEQLGIQPVFYGMDDVPERFWSMLPRIVATHRDEHESMIDAAYDRVATMLRLGADYDVAPSRLSFDELWQRRGTP
jgi:hypothetical protein